MARISLEQYTSSEAALINLTNLISRLEDNLSSGAYQQQLLESEFHRARVATNIEHGRTLLLQLERSLPSIKSLSNRNALQAYLAQKRQRITELKQCLDDLALRSVMITFADDEASSDNDIFIYTPEESTSGTSSPPLTREQRAQRPVQQIDPSTDDVIERTPSPEENTPSTSVHDLSTAPATVTATEELKHGTTTLRKRPRGTFTAAKLPREPISSTGATTATSHPTTAPSSVSKTQATESALSRSRAEQESLTNSLLSLASQLKESSQYFQTSLESEKSILGRAAEGLDRNIAGMDAAGRRMGMLRRMTEGRGWWGRMLMYVWIVVLWFVALFIVYLGPKLRF
ncbi:hypothetical protein VTO42DRAFT_5592 [Malbranchea cinnamomea]